MNKAGPFSLYCHLWCRWQPIPLDDGLNFFSASLFLLNTSQFVQCNFDMILIDMTDDGRIISSSVWSGFSFACYGSNSCWFCLFWWLVSNSHLLSFSFVSDIERLMEIAVLWYFEVLSYFYLKLCSSLHALKMYFQGCCLFLGMFEMYTDQYLQMVQWILWCLFLIRLWNYFIEISNFPPLSYNRRVIMSEFVHLLNQNSIQFIATEEDITCWSVHLRTLEMVEELTNVKYISCNLHVH